jgi:hypothetical protein
MKKFDIRVISSEPEKINGLLAYWGQITIGHCKDKFIMPIANWTLEDYKQQWREGIERLKTYDNSCVVVTAQNMDTYPFIRMWLLYKVSEKVFIQEQLLNSEIAEEFNPPLDLSKFNSKTCYQFVSPRIVNEKGEGINEDGGKLCEWSVPLAVPLLKLVSSIK